MNANTTGKRQINAIYVNGEHSPFGYIRGRRALEHFEENWRRMSDVNITYTNHRTFSDMDIGSANVIWLDNVRSITVAKKIESIKEQFGDSVRVVYSLDDFIWEGPAGRASSLNDCRVVEMFIGVTDALVVTTYSTIQLLNQMRIVDEEKEFIVIPTTVGYDFFPTYSEFRKTGISNGRKANVLVKGLTIPNNVQNFIAGNYKNFNITISSVGQLSNRIMNLISNGEISHIKHWANPDVNGINAAKVFAMERDRKFDFTVLTKPDDLSSEYYELVSDDEDVVFAIASGSLPVCGVDHVGYNEDSPYYASGLVFDSETDAAQIARMITLSFKSANQYNKNMEKALVGIKDRVADSPKTLRAYYTALVGTKIVEAEVEEARKAFEEMNKKNSDESPVETDKSVEAVEETESSVTESSDDTPENVIKADFGGNANG